MENKDIITYIEDKNIKIENNWFYHGTPFCRDKYQKILKEGILSPKLQSDRISSYEYVFVSKATDNKYSFFNYYSMNPLFIVDGRIKAISTYDGFIKKILYNGYHGIKFTSMFEEYQVYNKIEPKDIIGILFNLEKNISNYHNKKYYLEILYELTILLKDNNIDLPIIDYYMSKEINKEKVLKLNF